MPVLFKIILSLLLLFIIFNLGVALFKMVTYNKPKSNEDDDEKPFPMSRYLGRRLIISIIVIVIVIIALQTGIINPNPRPY